MEQGEKLKGSWWQTMPGILTAAAGIITALTGLIVALNQIGLFSSDKIPHPQTKTEVVSTPDPPTSKQSPGEPTGKENRDDKLPARPHHEVKAGILFQDQFERPHLGDGYEILNGDPNRLSLSDNQIIISAAPVAEKAIPKNVVLLQQRFDGDFVATIRLTMQVTKHNQAGMLYWIDSRNRLFVGIHGLVRMFSADTEGRHVGFTKFVDDEPNTIWQFGRYRDTYSLGSLGARQLQGYATKPEEWYLQLERRSAKYTSRVSIDGNEWEEVGTHFMPNRGGRIGFTAFSGKGGIENPAEFDDFIVKRIQ